MLLSVFGRSFSGKLLSSRSVASLPQVWRERESESRPLALSLYLLVDVPLIYKQGQIKLGGWLAVSMSSCIILNYSSGIPLHHFPWQHTH